MGLKQSKAITTSSTHTFRTSVVLVSPQLGPETTHSLHNLQGVVHRRILLQALTKEMFLRQE